MDELIIASRLVHFAALALLFGGSLFRLLIRPQIQVSDNPGPAPSTSRSWWRRSCPRWGGSSALPRA